MPQRPKSVGYEPAFSKRKCPGFLSACLASRSRGFMTLSDLRQMIENIASPRYVRQGKVPNSLLVTASYVERVFLNGLEPRMVALLYALRQQYENIYLLLDPGFDQDLEAEFSKTCQPVCVGVFLLPHEQPIEVWYEKLGAGNWLLMFSSEPILENVRLSDFEPVAENFGRLLSRTGAQVIILSWPDNQEWTVGWRSET
jgi:hypothetical protein